MPLYDKRIKVVLFGCKVSFAYELVALVLEEVDLMVKGLQ